MRQAGPIQSVNSGGIVMQTSNRMLDDIARPSILQGPETSLLFAAYQEIGS